VVDLCSNILEEHAACIFGVFLIQVDAEVVGKKGMFGYMGK